LLSAQYMYEAGWLDSVNAHSLMSANPSLRQFNSVSLRIKSADRDRALQIQQRPDKPRRRQL